jgi:hypothetical protein
LPAACASVTVAATFECFVLEKKLSRKMEPANEHASEPPKLRASTTGIIEPSSLADLVEWFLNFDERVARMRHVMIEELFQWKQADDEARGVATYPFENAEARFAIGIFQALEQNPSEPLLKLWITDVLNALHESKEVMQELADLNKLNSKPELSPVQRAELLTTNAERRFYLTSCWLEALCTAEARVLGWIYQEIYGRPFQPG